jgi:hypothetical protein
MAVDKSVFRQWKRRCGCGWEGKQLAWDYDLPTQCPVCAASTTDAEDRANAAHAVIGDEIDWVVPHGICHDDGTPKRFRSRVEWKRAMNAKGWTQAGDTPKPYRV